MHSAPRHAKRTPTVKCRRLILSALCACREFVREVELQTARTAAPQHPVTAEDARNLFDNLAKQLDEPVDYEAVRERNLRRLSREQRLIDSDIDAVAEWVDGHQEEVREHAGSKFYWLSADVVCTDV